MYSMNLTHILNAMVNTNPIRIYQSIQSIRKEIIQLLEAIQYNTFIPK